MKLKNEGDQYNEQNLEWLGQALLASIGTSLASTLEKYVTTKITGPELFFHIMETLESTSSSVLRTVERELTEMRLRQEAGENVNTFTSTMMAKIRRLEGANRLPHDLGQIMARALMDCSVESFRMQFTHIYNEFEINPKKYKYQVIINLATSSYKSCLDNKM